MLEKIFNGFFIMFSLFFLKIIFLEKGCNAKWD